MLTQLQKQEFYRNGFTKVAGVVPRLMVDAARQAINHSIGSIGKCKRLKSYAWVGIKLQAASGCCQ